MTMSLPAYNRELCIEKNRKFLSTFHSFQIQALVKSYYLILLELMRHLLLPMKWAEQYLVLLLRQTVPPNRLT